MNSLKPLNRSVLRADTVQAAKSLLGCVLYRRIGSEHLAGRIVETEAYLHNDPACHASRGMTKRNAPMFEDAGISYVYFTYGMHHCFNIVTNTEGVGEAVLIRALEPLQGIERMYEKRGSRITKVTELLSGPAKICQAFSLTTSESGIDLLTSRELSIEKRPLKKGDTVGISSRIGITAGVNSPWRFYLEGNPYVSKGKPSGN